MLGRGAGGALFVLCFLLAAPVAGQVSEAWTQQGGGPTRAGVAAPPAGPLDVLGTYRTLEDRETFPLNALTETSHGLVGIASRRVADAAGNLIGFNCTLVRVLDPIRGQVARGAPWSCPFGAMVQGYDPVGDQVLICRGGGTTDPILEALDSRTLEVRWGITMADLGVVDATSGGQGQARGYWICSGTAIDPADGLAISAFFRTTVTPAFGGSTRNRIAAVALADGAVVWDTSIHPTTFYNVLNPLTPTGALSDEVADANDAGFSPRYVTRTSGGSVVVGFLPQLERAIAWLDNNGTVLFGTTAAANQNKLFEDVAGGAVDTDSRLFLIGEWATASGTRAAIQLGDRLVFVDPSVSTAAVRRVPLEYGTETGPQSMSTTPLPAARWWGQDLVVPTKAHVQLFRGGASTPEWIWPSETYWVADTLLVPPGDLYVAGALRRGETREGRLFHLDLATGAVRDAIPIPVPTTYTGGFRPPMRFLPLGEDQGVLLTDGDGNITVLGTADPTLRPALVLSNLYPLPNERITLSLPSDQADVREYIVAWGDGSQPETGAPGSRLSHQYTDPAARNLRVTAVFADRRTATTDAIVSVGGTPPPDLNALQNAFAPENQDMTFGVLGILLALGSGAYALAKRRKHHSRLEDELTLLRRLRQEGLTDPARAIRALAEYRHRIENDLGAGRLNDAQFSVLSIQATQAIQTFRERLLAPFGSRISSEFERRFAGALADGIVTEMEATDLLAGLSREKRLTKDERTRLAAAIRSMT